MAKNDDFKQNVMDRIIAAFGKDVVGIYDKKLYVTASVGGDKTQVAIALTVPKAQIEPTVSPRPQSASSSGFIDFEAEESAPTTLREITPTEISQTERNIIEELMKELGL